MASSTCTCYSIESQETSASAVSIAVEINSIVTEQDLSSNSGLVREHYESCPSVMAVETSPLDESSGTDEALKEAHHHRTRSRRRRKRGK